MSTPDTTTPDINTLEKGQEIGSREVRLSRADLLRYAAASGDHNPIHWNERFAREVGLDGVIAHGMLTMGLAVDLATDWVGDPGRVVDYQARFTKPVPVPDAEAGPPDTPTATLLISGKVGAVDVGAATARVDLTVSLEGAKVLAKSQVSVRL
ncbi:MaoC family dehydratase [Nesterenkonia sp. PF2B19]|uniref:MaoC family dehydratase n=1 Tax=Nesterenkonia sp. PF2B19 TaxID=1881858 RepID=UPI000871D8F9|nr:MaoC family dehydratase [Nesterenkonia sp. PF2B19]OSM43157.1 acyl dehydratase [Nesterenkonia sp. PF2B19]